MKKISTMEHRERWRELTADAFYARRDERTETLIAGSALRDSRLVLSIDTEEASRFSGQVCFLTMANLNARWCREIMFVAPDVALHPDLAHLDHGEDGTLLSAAQGTARRADPLNLGTGNRKSVRRELTEDVIRVHVGTAGPECAYQIVGRGWIAGGGPCLRHQAFEGEERNPLGAALAATVGTCYAMRRSLGHERVFSDVKLSLWNLAEDDEAVDGPPLSEASLGRVLVVGAGAIGSGILYLLPLLKQRPSAIDIVDGDLVDYPNLNRVPLFFADDVGRSKVDIVREYIVRSGIAARPIPAWFSDANVSLQDYDLVVPAANEYGVRQSLMHNFPPLMISGSTGSQWDAYRQRHMPTVDDCLVCRFPEAPQAPKLACSTGTLTTEGAPAEGAPSETGALPFLSVAGAVMAVAEIARLGYRDSPVAGNYCALWFKGESISFLNANKEKRSGCSYCIDKSLFDTVGRKGLFSGLSEGTQ